MSLRSSYLFLGYHTAVACGQWYVASVGIASACVEHELSYRDMWQYDTVSHIGYSVARSIMIGCIASLPLLCKKKVSEGLRTIASVTVFAYCGGYYTALHRWVYPSVRVPVSVQMQQFVRSIYRAYKNRQCRVRIAEQLGAYRSAEDNSYFPTDIINVVNEYVSVA